MSRWIELYATSPSGKTLFVCRMCGDISPVPGKTCPARPQVNFKMPLECSLLEEIEGALNEEQGMSPTVQRGWLVLVGEKATPIEGERVRLHLQWRTLSSQWNTTDLYVDKDVVPK